MLSCPLSISRDPVYEDARESSPSHPIYLGIDIMHEELRSFFTRGGECVDERRSESFSWGEDAGGNR